jgi:EF-hand domain pair
MSVSSINSYSPFSKMNSIRPASSEAKSTSTSSSSEPEPSSQVTLSANARAIASLAAKGVTLTQTQLSPPELADARSGNLVQLGSDIAGSSGSPPPNGEISQSDFEQLLQSQFGATQSQADQLFKGFDTNDDGSISNAELLNGLAGTLNSTPTGFDQTLLSVMDTSDNGTVSQPEFTQFESAMVGIEKSSG